MEIRQLPPETYPGVSVREDGVIYYEGQELNQVPQGPNRMLSVAVRKAFQARKSYVNVHRLVALAFLGDPPNKRDTVKHRDKDKRHNHYTNLEYTTRYNSPKRDRILYMIKTGYDIVEIQLECNTSKPYIKKLIEENLSEINSWRASAGVPPLDLEL